MLYASTSSILDNPDASKCDGPTQWHLDKLEELLDFIGIPRKVYHCDSDNCMYTVLYTW